MVASDRLTAGYALDRLWSETMGLPDGDTKEKPLRLIAELLAQEQVAYALIGGVAVQIHTAEPRTTLDIDIAVESFAAVPHEALVGAGFEHTGRHEHSDNWRAPGPAGLRVRTAVQFSAEDTGLAAAISGATVVELGEGVRLRVAAVPDLVHLKLLAAEEPKRRASKRTHDIADVLALLEEHPAARTPEFLRRLQTLGATLPVLEDGVPDTNET